MIVCIDIETIYFDILDISKQHYTLYTNMHQKASDDMRIYGATQYKKNRKAYAYIGALVYSHVPMPSCFNDINAR